MVKRELEDPPGLRDPGLAAVLLVCAVGLAWSWSRIEGYQLADTVEDLEWAEALLGGERVVDSEATRPLGFVALLAPLFWIARLLGAITGHQDPVIAVHLARLLQIGLALALVWVAVRLAFRAGGRWAGYAAGVLLATNPLVLRWGVTPISGFATGLLIALAAELVVRDDERRSVRQRGWLIGLALGGAGLMAYKSLAIALPVLGFALLAPVGRRPARGAILSGLALCALAQGLADAAYYGELALSARVYLLQNVGGILPPHLHRLGEWIGSDALMGLARRLYEAAREAHRLEPSGQLLESAADARSLLPRSWYLTHLGEALTWPGLALLVTGALVALRRRSRELAMLALVVAFYVVLMSGKGSKEYRLWIPILPMIAVLGGVGAAALAALPLPGRRTFACALVGAAALLGPSLHARVNVRRFGGYWRAMEYVNRSAAEEAETVTVAAAFHWAAYRRGSPQARLIKLPKHVDDWEGATEDRRRALLAALGERDYFIAHLPVLSAGRSRLLEAVGRDFSVRAAFFDDVTETSPGPVLVFARRTGADRGPDLVRVARDIDPLEWAEERGLEHALAFEGAADLAWLGYELTPLDGDGLCWLTHHWFGTRSSEDYLFVDRVTLGTDTVWTNDHAPARGLHPTSSWPTEQAGGWILSEGYLVLPRRTASANDEATPELWVGVATRDAGGGITRFLTPVRPSDGLPIEELAPPGAPLSPEGWRSNGAGLTRVGALALPPSR